MKVSAIISAYFCEEYLEGRIENLKAQTLRPQIVVVAEDWSQELEIAENLCDPLIDTYVITPDVPTIYKAWNLGIKAAKGEYITNANSDDRLADYGIFKLAHELDKRPEVGLVYADVDIVESLEGGFNSAWREGYFRWAEGGHKELLQQCFLGPMPMWRKSLHEKYGYFDPQFQSAGDYEYWLRLAKAGVKFHHLREVLGIYLRRDDQAEQRFGREGIGASETLTARMRYP
jgi:glycosyltransferase involved in cell wall biosynthesis